MQKPDANGYVNVVWPSKTIPHGGIFHTRIVEPSEKQQQFLRVLLEESKLDIAQRRKTALALRRDEEEPQHPRAQMAMPVVRPRTSKRRSLSAIRESGIYEMTDYCPPKRGEDREKLKERLAQFMEYGDLPEEHTLHLPTTKPDVKAPPKIPTNKEMWNDIVTQIRERADWLAEMEYLGQAGPHRDIIKEQIAERMRALDALGVESTCTSARSSASGFSTTRSREPVKTTRSQESVKKSTRSQESVKKSTRSQERVEKSTRSQESAKSGRSNCSNGSKKQTTRPSPKTTKPKDENVASYKEMLTPLQYSPRRRL